jgi:hypothetical protein
VVSAKITKKGRKAIASGSFNIAYFQIGDSEFDYTGSLSILTGSVYTLTGAIDTHQYVLSPFDGDNAVKYPFNLDSNTTTTYGIPVLNPDYTTTNLRNLMGPAGHVSNYLDLTGTTIQTHKESVLLSSISGNTLSVATGSLFAADEFITLALKPTSGTTNVITGNTTSLTYKILSKSGNTLTLDRNLPNLTSLTGAPINGVVFNNLYDNEYNVTDIEPGCLPTPISSTSQLNSWTLNTIWTTRPIGAKTSNEDINGYTSNRYASVKNFLGYTTSSGQTFQNLSGSATSTGFTSTLIGTSFKNCKGDIIEVSPEEQRSIAILHYSELGDLIYDPERFFKYDDFISHLTTTGNTITDDVKTDNDYFEIYIPYIFYHRDHRLTGTTTSGAIFRMDTTDYYVKSTTGVTESTFNVKFRYLIDANNNRVGKVFVNHKVIVFDDQELVAILDYRSNRKYTLPAPKLRLIGTGDLPENSLLSSTGQTLWVTYAIANEIGSTLNALPCNYYSKITGTTTASSVTLNFDSSEFSYMVTGNSLNNIVSGFLGKKIFLLMQLTTGTSLPSANSWKYADYTNKIASGIYNGTTYIQPSDLTSYTYVIDYATYQSATTFDLDSHMTGLTSNYLGTYSATDFVTTTPQFGDEQPFPGSIRLVRGSDIEEFNFLINLPNGKFETSQNPTYPKSGTLPPKYITEIALLDVNKNALVVAKTPTPIKRTGAQVFSVRLDF